MSDDQKSTWLAKTILAPLAVLFLIVISFLYAYLTRLNPLIYFNFVFWLVFSVLLTIPISVISGLISRENILIKVATSLIISSVSIYLVLGMQSSIYMTTVQKALLGNGSMWLPKVSFGDILNTLFSAEEYKNKLNLLVEFDTLNISFRGSKSEDFGSGFTNFIRFIECGGLVVIPLLSLKSKPKMEANKLVNYVSPSTKPTGSMTEDTSFEPLNTNEESLR